MENVTLTRPVEAIEIPYGTKVMLPAGAEVRITQSLGGSFTVMTEDGYMARIADKDADALGKTPTKSAEATSAEGPLTREDLEKRVWGELETIFDPEIPVNVVDLGLVYECNLSTLGDGFRVDVKMTLTAPGCGMGDIPRKKRRPRSARCPASRKWRSRW